MREMVGNGGPLRGPVALLLMSATPGPPTGHQLGFTAMTAPENIGK